MNNGDLSADLVKMLLKDRRRERFWRNLRFLLVIFLFAVIAWGIFSPSTDDDAFEGNDYVSLIKLSGMIAPGASFSAEEVVPQLKKAFADKHSKGVILDIDSGGGTPVQASIIHDQILQLKKQYHKKVIVVGEDLLASGAYLVAVSGDKIFVNPNTITGSIGVVMAGFGANDVLKKVGIDRRVYTSGVNKNRLDQFLPPNPQDIAKIQSVLDEVHQNFNQIVQEGRKGKLHGDENELFSGDFWTGQKALELGLVDGFGNVWDVMQNEFHVSHHKTMSSTQEMLKSFVNQIGSSFALPLQGQASLHFI